MNSIGEAIRSATEYLTAHPDEAQYTDSAAVASLDNGLRVTVRAPDGQTVATDMPKSVGGQDTAPSSGWLFRAALAACDTTLIAMRAAMLGVELRSVEVTIDSESNDYGILGIEESVPAGPLNVRRRVRVEAPGTNAGAIRDLVEWAVAHCPVDDATRRTIPMTLEIEAAS
ncbi:MAG TPA: OsmC family protein [Actinomycetota bacterium]|nr:OsmC family protein [Actinomycetota bacterium]